MRAGVILYQVDYDTRHDSQDFTRPPCRLNGYKGHYYLFPKQKKVEPLALRGSTHVLQERR